MWSESSGFEQAPGNVVGQVAQALGCVSGVFKPAVGRFGRAVTRAGTIKVAEDVVGALRERSSELSNLDHPSRNKKSDAFDRVREEEFAESSVRSSIRGDQVLVDAPRRLHLTMTLVSKQRLDAGLRFSVRSPAPVSSVHRAW